MRILAWTHQGTWAWASCEEFSWSWSRWPIIARRSLWILLFWLHYERSWQPPAGALSLILLCQRRGWRYVSRGRWICWSNQAGRWEARCNLFCHWIISSEVKGNLQARELLHDCCRQSQRYIFGSLGSRRRDVPWTMHEALFAGAPCRQLWERTCGNAPWQRSKASSCDSLSQAYPCFRKRN